MSKPTLTIHKGGASKSNFELQVNEIPGLSFTYFDTKRYSAIRSALRDAPGCTFTIREFSGTNPFTEPFADIAHLHKKTDVEKLLRGR